MRRAGLRVDRAWDDRSMKAQMKVADRSGAALAVIVGAEEFEAGEVTLEVDYHHGPQGIVDSWVEHWEKRRAMDWKELGAITGA